jgi:hypothetical protein
MTRAISRDAFDELKNYLGVYLQQGRVVLDADWNENQDIAVSFLRRLTREALGDGSPNTGFAISPAFPPPLEAPQIHINTGGDPINAIAQLIGACLVDILFIAVEFIFGSIPFFLSFPGFVLDDFEQLGGWSITPNIGNLRLGQDRPYRGRSFLRLSGHTANVLTEIAKTLPNAIDISAFETATFRFRLNQQVTGDYKFFLEDVDGNRTIYLLSNPAFAKEFWMSGFAAPLNASFHLLTSAVFPGFSTKSYESPLATFGGTLPSTWSIQGGPPWLIVEPDDDTEKNTIAGKLRSDPNVNGGDIPPGSNGTYTFTVTANDADGNASSRQYTLKVSDPPDSSDPGALLGMLLQALGLILGDLFPVLMQPRVSNNGAPADLTRIKKYGFNVYQDAQPLVWDFDDLELGSVALQRVIGENNFIIRGSEFGPFLNTVALISLLQGAGDIIDDDDGGNGDDDGGDLDPLTQNLLDLLNNDFDILQPSIEHAGKMFVGGLPCVQISDQLYSEQADPNDPLLAPPQTGQRTDTVYLDVWTDAVTYIEDPAIRELALGGPDTSTRLKIRQRVRVNQGGGIPTGDGRGLGTLATAGTYTGTANRFYRVEIDGAGDIGTATFQWSDDNASTLARVIEPIPPGSTRVVVEDASAFQQDDRILIRKEFGSERHIIASVFSNVITLQQQTGDQLALMPAARDPSFTTFALADHPMVQRWNDYGVPIPPDPSDPTISAAIPLNDGVQLRFGGRAMVVSDYWNFRTRFLAGDEAAGIGGDARIEPLSFQSPKGVIHHYAALATFVRDATATEPQKIGVITDRRQRAGNASTTAGPIADIQLADDTLQLAGGMTLPVIPNDSKVVVFLTATLFMSARLDPDTKLTVQVSFYNDKMTNPETEPDNGKIQDRTQDILLASKPLDQDIPIALNFVSSGLSLSFLPPAAFSPTSIQLLFQLSEPGTTVEVTGIQLFALELKKSF